MSHQHYQGCLFVRLFCFVTPGGFTTMVANKGLEEPGSLGPIALHPLRRMWCNFRWKHLQTTSTHFFGQSWVDS